MKLVGRQDWVLVGALGFAFAVIFAGPIRYLLNVAWDVERSSGLTLVPALIILIEVLAFHQQGKRQEANAIAAAS